MNERNGRIGPNRRGGPHRGEGGFTTMLMTLMVILALLLIGLIGVSTSTLNTVVAGHDRYTQTAVAVADGGARYAVALADGYMASSVTGLPGFSLSGNANGLPNDFGFYSGHLNGSAENVCSIGAKCFSCLAGTGIGNDFSDMLMKTYRLVLTGTGPNATQHEEELFFVYGP